MSQPRDAASVMESSARTAVLKDHHPLWMAAVEQVVGRLGLAVVGKATDPERALALIEKHRPSLFVAGLDGPGDVMDEVACVREARELVPEVKIIVLSAESDPHAIDAALDAGASAYVVKTAHPDDLASAIRQAFEHSVHFAAVRAAAPRPVRAVRDVPALTRREQEILQFVVEGHSNGQVAKALWVTEQTVKFHLSNIYRKLGVANRTEASRRALLEGLVDDAPLREVHAPLAPRAGRGA